jgi:type I restriction enzyme M protein
VDKVDIKTTIYQHPEFADFIAQMNAHFAAWKKKNAGALKALKPGFHPKELIASLSESLLDHYADKPLIESYDIYQHLMDYWATTMQDDAYLVASDGWQAETYRVIETKKGKDGKPGKEVDKGWACDLVPKALIVAKVYAKEQAAIDEISAGLEATTAKLAELEEERGGEEGAFSELDKVNRANVADRLKEIKGDREAKDEIAALTAWLEHNTKEADLKKRLKDTEAGLDAKALAHYPKLTEAEVKSLVVDDKWMAALDTAIHGEMDRISQQLTQRVKELAKRYGTPLPQVTERVAELEAKVNRHLKQMGFEA